MESITTPPNRDGVAYLYGHPLRNSLSPPLHQTVYNHLGLNWTQIPLSSATANGNGSYTKSPEIPTFLSSIRSNPKFVGSSVTMPWKVAIMPHLDDLTEDARQAGACNTIFLRKFGDNTEYVGTNTDCIGIREALVQGSPTQGKNFRGKPALIVGGGGTARTAIYVLRKWLGVSKIYVVNRDVAEVEAILAEDSERNGSKENIAPLIHVSDPTTAAGLEAPVAIVSGIPNYPPKTEEEIKARETLRVLLNAQKHEADQGVILEMCYHPVPWTDIAQMAADARWKVILGSEALIWQGLEQARLWTGRDIVNAPGLVDKVKGYVAQTVAERSKSNL